MHVWHLQTRKTFKNTARVCKIKGSTLRAKKTSHCPIRTPKLSILAQNMNQNHPQNYSEIPPSILSRFRTHFGSDWGRILPPVWPRTNLFGPQRPSQWPQKVPRGPKGLPWGAPWEPKGSPRGPTMPFWPNFGRWFPGGSANFALNHPKNVADLRPCLPTISEISLCRHGDEAQHDWCQPSALLRMMS